MSQQHARSVGEVATLAHVTIRTLHHHDEIGLVSPNGRSGAGYRLYDDRDLERLQQLLLYRQLGLTLEHIRAVMSAPDFDRGLALREQRALQAPDSPGRLTAGNRGGTRIGWAAQNTRRLGARG